MAGDSAPITTAAPAPLEGVPPALVAAVEALLLVTSEPLSARTLADLLEVTPVAVKNAITALAYRLTATESGLMVVEIAGGYQLGSRPEHAAIIEKMLHEVRRVRLSVASLETLAIVAYRQPVTRNEIETIRGVNIDGVMKTLLERELIKILGKKDEPGRPLLYGTTETFLLLFGLKSLADLPPLSEFDEIARARALAEMEEPTPDWQAISASQRDQLSALTDAAERELAGLDEKLAQLKPPRVVILEEKPD